MINRLKQRVREDEGFTLIELLIVIVVLGILAAIVVFALSNQTSNAAKSACNADAKSVEVAVEAFRAQTSNYPPDVATLTIGGPVAYLRQAPPTAVGIDAAGVPNGTLPTGAKYAIQLGQVVPTPAPPALPVGTGVVYVLSNGGGGWVNYDAPGVGNPNPCNTVN